ASANERAASLELEIAEAKRRQAEAEKSLLELQNRLRPRSISPEQREKLSLELRKRLTGSIVIHFPSMDAEAEQFALQIAEVLHENNWEVLDCSPIMRIGGIVPKGLCIEGRSQTTVMARELEQSFINSEIEIVRTANPQIENFLEVRLMVGVKP
ncbi:MAG TPA: hypothetical protein VNB22_11280, partial [Pyrinomonadaceae bacterium]|nr:hypothetical protein [Pyrinomonadaceae bacterium]